MAWLPTCTNPLTGTSIPTYQSQPNRRYGCLRREHNNNVIATNVSKAATAFAGASPSPG